MEIDDKLKALIKELGTAINEAISNSESIGQSLDKIRTNGYDLFLMLEATVGLQKKGAKAGKVSTIIQSVSPAAENLKFEISADDRDFLRSMKIKVDDRDDESPG
jgi:hypothetical protein